MTRTDNLFVPQRTQRLLPPKGALGTYILSSVVAELWNGRPLHTWASAWVGIQRTTARRKEARNHGELAFRRVCGILSSNNNLSWDFKIIILWGYGPHLENSIFQLLQRRYLLGMNIYCWRGLLIKRPFPSNLARCSIHYSNLMLIHFITDECLRYKNDYN